MDLLHEKCAGLDVHKKTVVASVRVISGGQIERHLQTFGTTTRELLALAAWLHQHAITQVAMEATGVYWKPVLHVLEAEFELHRRPYSNCATSPAPASSSCGKSRSTR